MRSFTGFLPSGGSDVYLDVAVEAGTRDRLVRRPQLRPPAGNDFADLRAGSGHCGDRGGNQDPVTAADGGLPHTFALQRNVAVFLGRP
jgi:hypothetical protein